VNGHEMRQVGTLKFEHQESLESGMVNFTVDLIAVYACSCGSLVWDPEKHSKATLMSAIGL
jgi:hypothetical protein